MSAISANPAAAAPRSRNRAWGKFKRNHIAMLGLAIVLFFVALALLAPLVANHDPFQTSFTTIRRRRRRNTGWARTSWAATSSAAWSMARAPRSWPAWCRC